LGENLGVFESPDLWFVEDAEIFLGGRIGSFGGGTEGFEFMMPVGSAEDPMISLGKSLTDIWWGNP